MKKNPPENKPTQWEIGQPSDVFSKNPVKIKIPLGLLQRGVHVEGTLLTASRIVTINSHDKTILDVHTNIGTYMGTNCILLLTEVASNVTVHSNAGAISSAIYMGINNSNITESNLPVPHSHL